MMLGSSRGRSGAGVRAELLPGAVALARLTGAPLLMGIAHRAADYRHQVLEISAPVPAPHSEGCHISLPD
jgi:lauroyl/myristoyl acyltransferase